MRPLFRARAVVCKFHINSDDTLALSLLKYLSKGGMFYSDSCSPKKSTSSCFMSASLITALEIVASLPPPHIGYQHAHEANLQGEGGCVQISHQL